MPCFHLTASQQASLFLDIDGWLPPAQRYSLISAGRQQCTVHSNMPAQWQHDFLSRGLHRSSSIVGKAKGRLTPYAWTPGDAQSSHISSLADKYDIDQGVTFTFRTQEDIFLFSLYFSRGDASASQYCRENVQHIQFALCQILEKLSRLQEPPFFTPREVDVLNLLKIGKTYSEIALILGISGRTARFHTGNILEKLQVTSVRYAIYLAAIRGWI
ncbi:LuxR C-terminal-related transcriptional regulator [Citrobacter sp. S2-9]|uniref:LuxR C-terminal-related transcriptional regulator n=1 Tax=Citrobacter enshiensis TaxID=2971264 RepID=A0ABT8PR85_9ENTR|nr:LuxR C-terminal-related transcriptional regulator [Citrobacter enshiensis]MDN8598853.1 LuxR C-terminal-related transcriptional regulator [Citrobacter enshiensis]